MGKDLKIKHSVSSSSYKVWEKFFHKKVFHGGTNIFGKIFGGTFYMEAYDQIKQGLKLIVKRFQRSSQVSLSSH